METLIIFVLGAISALGILGLGYITSTVLKIKKLNKKNKENIDSLFQRLDELDRNFGSEMINLDADFRNRIKDLNSYVDSRFDKHTEKISNIIEQDVLDLKEEIKNFKKLHTMQMDQFAKATLLHSERLADLETVIKIEQDKLEQINS